MKKPLLFVFWWSCLQIGSLLAFSPQAPALGQAEAQSITLPTGAQIAITTVDRINSKTADLKREYAASVDDPVVVNGVTVVPARANAFLRVTEVKNSRLKRASMSISLVAVTVNGQRVAVDTDTVDSQSGSKVTRTAIGAGVGAATGAAIGAAVGGAAGAGIGASIGSVTGAGAGILTGKPVEIAPETRFTYKLTQPVAIDKPAAAAPEARIPPAQQAPADAALPVIAPPPPPPGEPQAPPQRSINSGSEPELIGAVYFQNEAGALIPLERKDGCGSYWRMEGPRSSVRLPRMQKMLFVVRLANGIDPNTYKLFPLDPKTGGRRTRSGPKNGSAPQELGFDVTKLGESTYGLTPVRDLAAGEYAFSPTTSNNAYCFGIDQ
jgi:hypothetical protein